jgi:hypothetical protein
VPFIFSLYPAVVITFSFNCQKAVRVSIVCLLYDYQVCPWRIFTQRGYSRRKVFLLKIRRSWREWNNDKKPKVSQEQILTTRLARGLLKTINQIGNVVLYLFNRVNLFKIDFDMGPGIDTRSNLWRSCFKKSKSLSFSSSQLIDSRKTRNYTASL